MKESTEQLRREEEKKQPPEVFYKKDFCNVHSKTSVLESLILIKLQTFRSATLLKRDSNTGVFL